jgi:hypothetical protein
MIKRSLIIASFVLVSFGASLQAGEVEIQGLLKQSLLYDNKAVEVKGEVLEVLERGSGAWMNILAGSVAMGVWVQDKEIIPFISYLGSYESEGDIVRVEGIFYQELPGHLGRTGIRAKTITIEKRGRYIERSVSFRKKKEVSVWAGIFFLSLAVYTGKSFRNRANSSLKKDRL